MTDQISALLLIQGIAIARGLVHLTEGCAEVFLTNFTNECQRIAKGTAVACFEEIADGQGCFALLSDTSSDSTSPAVIDVNLDLPPDQQQVLHELLNQFAD